MGSWFYLWGDGEVSFVSADNRKAAAALLSEVGYVEVEHLKEMRSGFFATFIPTLTKPVEGPCWLHGDYSEGLDEVLGGLEGDARRKARESALPWLKDKFFREFLEEWGRRLEKGDSTVFAQILLKHMKNRDSKTGWVVSGFVSWMVARDWETVKTEMYLDLSPSVRKAFALPQAERFYMDFREVVVEAVRDYFQSYVEGRKRERGKHDAH